MNDYNNFFDREISCPTRVEYKGSDLCQDYQMQGNAEFVPRVLEEELEESWVLQCKYCETLAEVASDPFKQPEMVLE